MALWQAASSFPAVLTVLLIGVAFSMCRGGFSDPDIWWHLRNAEALVQNHQLPNFDSYSFTVAGQPWMNHEWLSELPFYFGWKALGLTGILGVEFAVIVAIFLALLYLSYQESRNIKAAVGACCFSVFLATVSFGPRTILLGYLFMMGLLIVLQRFRLKGSAPLWVLPPLFCLWINTHGSWLIGLVVFAIIVGGGLVEFQMGRVESVRWSPVQLRRLVPVWVLSAAAVFINPWGYRLVWYPFDLAFRQKLNVAHVAEWVPVNFHDSRGKLVLVLLAVLLLSALLRRTRWTLTELGLVLLGLYSGLTHIRFLFLLAILVAPLLAKVFDFFPPYQPELETPRVNLVAMAVMIVAMVYFWPSSADLERQSQTQYPAEVLPFLQAHPPAGPMLNFYLWGGYLGWHDRSLKAFVDSRVDIFEYSGVLQDYINVLALQQPDAVFAKYKIRYVLFPPNEPLVYALKHGPSWRVLYEGKISVLLERSGQPAAVSTGESSVVGTP
jgi:hypothetical protein